MSNFLRRLRANVFQVFINGHNAAVLHVAGPSVSIYVERAEVELLAAATGSITQVAARIAGGEFDDDFRFVISDEADEDGNYFLTQLATPSQRVMYASHMRDPYGFVKAERECQAERRDYPDLEDRDAHYAEMGL